jgi:hypothetical protein
MLYFLELFRGALLPHLPKGLPVISAVTLMEPLSATTKLSVENQTINSALKC